MSIPFILGSLAALFILSRYWRERSVKFRSTLAAVFCLLIFAAGITAAAWHTASVWYVAGVAPILCAIAAAFISLLVMPYSLGEATTGFHVPDYLHRVDPSEFMTTTFGRMPEDDHKGEALYTLLRVLYVITGSRKTADTLFRQLVNTSTALYEAGAYTPNSIYFSYIRQEICAQLGPAAVKRHSAAIDCAANLTYEAILSAHKSGELAPKQT